LARAFVDVVVFEVGVKILDGSKDYGADMPGVDY
jgi:hypothetical protein